MKYFSHLILIFLLVALSGCGKDSKVIEPDTTAITTDDTISIPTIPGVEDQLVLLSEDDLSEALFSVDSEKISHLVQSFDIANKKDDQFMRMAPLHILTHSCQHALTRLQDCANSASALLIGGANIDMKDDRGKTPLMYAVMNNDLLVLSTVFSVKADINSKDYMSNSAWDYASYFDNASALSTLQDKGAVSGKNQNTSQQLLDDHLFQSLFTYNLSKARDLLKNGADANARDVNGSSPMHILAMSTSEAVGFQLIRNLFHELIAYGADINGTDQFGNTALMVAAQINSNNAVDFMEMILEKNASKDAKDAMGRTALSFAQDLSEEFLDGHTQRFGLYDKINLLKRD